MEIFEGAPSTNPEDKLDNVKVPVSDPSVIPSASADKVNVTDVAPEGIEIGIVLEDPAGFVYKSADVILPEMLTESVCVPNAGALKLIVIVLAAAPSRISRFPETIDTEAGAGGFTLKFQPGH